ncbi:unnamed protein product, partial [Anisakis simplex]|uniref:Catalase-rel domain-containing protein n=1 Tax=Anisakis simplex TaxID=6269 RepID=A0A0M3JLM5_ANISI
YCFASKLQVLDEAARERLVANIVDSLKRCLPTIQERVIENYTKVHQDFGDMLRKELQKAMEHKKKHEPKKFSAKESVMLPCETNPNMKNISDVSKHCRF